MRLSRSVLAVSLTLVLAATACSGDDAAESPTPDPTATSSAEPDQPATTPPADEPAAPEVGAMGSFTVDGQTFAVTDLNRCDPFFDEPGHLDLQAVAPGRVLGLRQDVLVELGDRHLLLEHELGRLFGLLNAVEQPDRVGEAGGDESCDYVADPSGHRRQDPARRARSRRLHPPSNGREVRSVRSDHSGLSKSPPRW